MYRVSLSVVCPNPHGALDKVRGSVVATPL